MVLTHLLSVASFSLDSLIQPATHKRVFSSNLAHHQHSFVQRVGRAPARVQPPVVARVVRSMRAILAELH